jgi:hypothetical protein
MPVLYGRIVGGRIDLPAPAGWPNGSTVRIELEAPPPGQPDDDDDSPTAVARRLALMDMVVPWMTPEEDAAWRAHLARTKAEQLALRDKANADIDGLFR